MENFILTIINKFGYFGIFLLIAIENVFPPIPSEVILTFSGFMTTSSKLSVIGVIIASTLGSTIGGIVLYSLGRFLNKERLTKIVSGKLGKVLHLKKKDIENADKWFDTKGQKTVFFCRFVPIVRSLISIPAGMSEMNFTKFLAYTITGTTIWNTVLTVLGSIVGKNWKKVVSYLEIYSSLVLIIILILIILGLIYFKRKGINLWKKKNRN